MAKWMLGVDPGMNETGIVLLEGQRVAKACVVTRDKTKPRNDYASEISAALRDYLQAPDKVTVCVEDVTAPKPFMNGKKKFINFDGLIGTSIILGVVLAICPEAILVAPGGNGSGLLEAYPCELIGPRETTGSSRHHATRTKRL